jgi:hypothetical protein
LVSTGVFISDLFSFLSLQENNERQLAIASVGNINFVFIGAVLGMFTYSFSFFSFSSFSPFSEDFTVSFAIVAVVFVVSVGVGAAVAVVTGVSVGATSFFLQEANNRLMVNSVIALRRMDCFFIFKII